MTDRRDPNLVKSSLSQRVTTDGITLRLAIYRLEHEPGKWALEVVNEAGTSTVWDDTFAKDNEACAALRDAVREEHFADFLMTPLCRIAGDTAMPPSSE